MTKRSIHIISHCWSYLPQYSYFMRMQLQSLMDTETESEVRIDIVMPDDDRLTFELTYGAISENKNSRLRIGTVCVQLHDWIPRARMRNQLSIRTEHDVVWFTDCDYLFFGGAVDSAVQSSLANPGVLVYPEHVWMQRAHEIGDQAVEQAKRTCDYSVDRSQFMRCWQRKAIGGVQIVDGEWCRGHGYLNGTRHTKPVHRTSPMHHRSDVPFRKSVGSCKRCDIPNVYRLRHTRAGYDG